MADTTPEAVLVLDSVRRLENHTDIGPGGVTRLLIAVNYAEAAHRVALLRAHGFIAEPAHDDICGATYGQPCDGPWPSSEGSSRG